MLGKLPRARDDRIRATNGRQTAPRTHGDAEFGGSGCMGTSIRQAHPARGDSTNNEGGILLPMAEFSDICIHHERDGRVSKRLFFRQYSLDTALGPSQVT